MFVFKNKVMNAYTLRSEMVLQVLFMKCRSSFSLPPCPTPLLSCFFLAFASAYLNVNNILTLLLLLFHFSGIIYWLFIDKIRI